MPKIHKADKKIKKWTEKEILFCRKKSGIYSVHLGKFCLYVGATDNFACRLPGLFYKSTSHNQLLSVVLQNHERILPDVKFFVMVYIFPKKDLLKKEQVYIKRLKPLFNAPNKLYASWH